MLINSNTFVYFVYKAQLNINANIATTYVNRLSLNESLIQEESTRFNKNLICKYDKKSVT